MIHIPAIASRALGPFVLILCLGALATLGAAWDSPVSDLRESPEAAALEHDFPFLAKLLTAEKPWEQEPAELARMIFERPPEIAQGSPAYPLLFQDQREKDGWPGEKVFDQWAYETEYYAFDRVHPVIKLHIGRPVIFSQQHGRVEAVAASRGRVAQFPFLDPQVIPPLLAQFGEVASVLAPFGARRLPSDHALVSTYALPNGVVMTVTNYTGSTNGTPYVEVMLTPAAPVRKFEGTQTLAFPGAEGFGRLAVGGRGGKVYVVTSLQDYLPAGRSGRKEGTYGQASEYATTLGEGKWRPYVDALGNPHPGVGQPLMPGYPALPPEPVIPGTLREAVEAEGPRYVVFAVSGDIELKSDLVIRNPYITIAGQSAPGDGVQIRNWGIKVETHDVILRHLRIRVGEIKGPGKLRRTLGEQTGALNLTGMNIIVDHCEAAYANDQIFNVYGHRDRRVAVTVQWSYIYGGPTRSTHEKGSHSMTSVGVGWSFVSLHHNLFAHTEKRNPRLDMLTYDFRNNVIYNFLGAGYGSDNDTRRLNYIGNTLKKGPDSKGSLAYAFAGKGHYWQAYGEGNQLPPDFKGVFEAPEGVVISHPIPFAPVTTHSAAEAYRLVLAQGGATKPARDRITAYVAQTVLDGTGFVPGTPDDWPDGGFASYAPAAAPTDRTGNGIPDDWEIEHGLDPAKSRATGRDLDPRYDNLEVYLNSL
jgi:pectate lyase